MNGVGDVIDAVHTWAAGEFAADFATVAKGVSTAELGRWRKTLPMLAVKPLRARTELVGVGSDGMRLLAVTVAFDVIDTTEGECWRLGDVVEAALRNDPDWGESVSTGDGTVVMDWVEAFDFATADDPLPFLVWRIETAGLTYGT